MSRRCFNWSVVSAKGGSKSGGKQSPRWVLVVLQHNNTRVFELSLSLGWAFKREPASKNVKCADALLWCPTWGCFSRLQSCFSLKTKCQQKWTICIISDHINLFYPATECFVKNTSEVFICCCFKWTCVSSRLWSCTMLLLMLPAGRLSHKLVRHEPDVTETAPVDGNSFFIFPLPDWNNPAIIVVVVLLARCKSEAVHVQSQEVQHYLRRLKGKWGGVML